MTAVPFLSLSTSLSLSTTRGILAAGLLALLPLTAAAGILGVDRGLGAATPMPEDLNLMKNGLRVGARVVMVESEGPAMTSAPGDHLRFEAGFLPGADLAPGAAVLDCTLRFVSARGERGQPVKSGPCFDGARAVAKGEWVLLDVTTEFTPETADPTGTSGVELTVTDGVSGATLVLMPTYGFSGGTE